MFGVPAPAVSPDRAAEIALAHYGVSAAAERLASEFDDTFRLAGADGSAWLLKISAEPAAAGGGGVGFQTALLLHLAAVAPQLPVQRVIATLDGRPEVTLPPASAEGEAGRLVRMTSWLDGRLLGAGTASAALRRDIGGTLARLNVALRGFAHPGAGRTHRWDLQNFGALRPLLDELPASGREGLAECLDRFHAVVAPRLAGVPTQVIHTDFHGENLLADGERVTGILDFGDALAGPVAMDVGVAACYQLGDGDLLAPAVDVVAGYHAADPLSDDDLSLAAEFMVARVAARIILSQAHAARDPANRAYLLLRTPQAIAHFAALRAIGLDEIGGRLSAACRLEVAQ
jgi:hydroxylysine kinase